jgi:hypothetical protein
MTRRRLHHTSAPSGAALRRPLDVRVAFFLLSPTPTPHLLWPPTELESRNAVAKTGLSVRLLVVAVDLVGLEVPEPNWTIPQEVPK